LILYLDASALVKLYTDEEHSDFVRRAASAAFVRVSHEIGYVECRAAFARKRRLGQLDAEDHLRCRKQLDRDWGEFHAVGVSAELIQRAAALSEEHGDRAYDSVHLAAVEAVYAASDGGADFRFSVFDTELKRAAQRAGFPLLEAGAR
jgi:predicted nucleic acid-binding protein